MVALLRWPDKMLARALVMGFEIVGDMAHSGVFRPIVQEGKLSLDQWLGTAAEADLACLLCSRPPEHVQDILDLTQDEIEKEFCSPLRTAREMDDVFGVGGWRFVERFLIIQPDGKKRAIDNARKSGHNAHTTMHETISTVNVDFCASVARMLHSEMTFSQNGSTSVWVRMIYPMPTVACLWPTPICRSLMWQSFYQGLDGDSRVCGVWHMA